MTSQNGSEPTAPLGVEIFHNLIDNRNQDFIRDLNILLGIVSKPQDLVHTPYQIHNFILNRKEFCTDFAQLKQAKIELFQRLCEINDMAYEYSKKELEIRKSQRNIDLLSSTMQDEILRGLEGEMIKLEIQQMKFHLTMIRMQAQGKLLEVHEFLKVYNMHKHIERLAPRELANLERKQWQTKAKYFPELQERYNLTPRGILPLPHETEHR